jgi:hypothetical protein
MQLKYLALGLLASTVILAGATLGAMLAHSQPVRKEGRSCPSGWASSSTYCSPPNGGRAQACVIKEGQCPGGTHQSGGFCCSR